ncbi:MAG: EEP domain-containing protein [Burkholderiales bacterium]|nr:MAG: EEP domain-containing protein [Betaproteobacteria bacterium]TAG82940.1 MAG: EEP domain-containing protein [Burkholderiales bacterium]
MSFVSRISNYFSPDTEAAASSGFSKSRAPASLRVATYNIHKGVSAFNRRSVVHDLREQLRTMQADIVFLQEVVGNNDRHSRRHADWPKTPQHEFLADQHWPVSAYGKNAIYEHGHHGNAILSAFPILRCEQVNISTNRIEQRGLLHAEIALPDVDEPLHCVCIHLGLFGRSRLKQIDLVKERIAAMVPRSAPLIVAGDFNDWRRRAGDPLHEIELREVFETLGGNPARSFPARLPILHLDRIYVRGLEVNDARVHRGGDWAKLSDHAALEALLTIPKR